MVSLRKLTGAMLVFTAPFTKVVDQTPCKASLRRVWVFNQAIPSFPLLPDGTTKRSLKRTLLAGRLTAADPNPLMLIVSPRLWVFNAKSCGFRSAIPRKVNDVGF